MSHGVHRGRGRLPEAAAAGEDRHRRPGWAVGYWPLVIGVAFLRKSGGTFTPVYGRSGLRCSGRESPGSGEASSPAWRRAWWRGWWWPASRQEIQQRIDMGERAWSAAKPTPIEGDPP